VTNGGFQNFLHAITGLPGGFATGVAPQPDTHDGGAKKADYFVWQEKDYKKHVLGIKEPEPEALAPEPPANDELPDARATRWVPPPLPGPSQFEVERTLFGIQRLADQLEAARAKALYLAQIGALLEAFAMREQAIQAEELALLLMLEN
jgi:hypothetical protein